MILKRRYWRLRAAFNEYPRNFWILMVTSFIDRLGGFILFPFFTLYITSRFGVGMTTVGIIFGTFSVTGIIGSTIGGALTDRLGRKPMLLFGLIVSAVSSIWLGFADSLSLFFAGAIFVGLFSNAGGPAQQAMLADILPDSQRAQGFAIWRVIVNLSAAIGPAIGGFLASRSFLALFITDAIVSVLVAIMIFFLLPETRTRLKKGKQESMLTTFRGYGKVLGNATFMFFWVASVITWLVYMQMNGTLAVYLRDTHSVTEQGFGGLVSLNALLVVLFQFAITRRVKGYPPFMVMAWGALLYAVGFGIYGFASDYSVFVVAMIIITIGEMLNAPIGQAVVANLAPENMRGRYMAFYGFSYAIPGVFGTLLAGLIMDNSDPRLVWYAAGLLGLLAAAMFVSLNGRADQEEPDPSRVRTPAESQY
ncbi:MAG: MFS transporter [Anaerolineales bacterium]|nr:MFS transporter [Anaerolineales bacterium]